MAGERGGKFRAIIENSVRADCTDAELRAFMTERKVPWPEPFALMGGARFSRVVYAAEVQDLEDVHRLPPSPPERVVPKVWEADEVVEWRMLSDEEWEDAQRAYAATVEEYDATNGFLRVPVGPKRFEASFLLEDGSAARGTYHENAGRWWWDEWGPAEKILR